MILSAMLWLQGVRVTDGPSLQTIISGFAAVVMLFILRAVIDSRDKVRSIWVALHGEPGASIKSGLVHDAHQLGMKLSRVAQQFEAHVTEEVFWQETLTKTTNARANEAQATLSDIDGRLERVEEWCTPKSKRKV